MHTSCVESRRQKLERSWKYAAGWLRNRRSNRSPLSETYYLQRTVIPASIPKKEKRQKRAQSCFL